MGVIKNLKDGVKNKAKNKIKGKLGALGIKASLPLLILVMKIIPIVILAAIAGDALSWVIQLITAKETPTEIYSGLEIENVTELIQIKGNDSSGYYLDFVDNIDDKLEKVIEDCNRKEGTAILPKSTEFLKKLIKAEVVTQFPDLKGTIDDGTDGFQGAIDIRRITPNKKIGELLNTNGWTTTVDENEEQAMDTQNLSALEQTVAKWAEGKELVTTTDIIVYDQEKSTLHEGEYIDSWKPRLKENTILNVAFSKDTTVTYTGKMGVNTNQVLGIKNVYAEVKGKDTNGEEITGFVKSENLKVKSVNEKSTSTINTSKNSAKTLSPVTSRADKTKKNAGKEGEEYTIAIAAGHNSTDDTGASYQDLNEEDITIDVAEMVEDMLSIYSNIKVVQTGSTSNNPGGVSVGDRVSLADAQDPDLVIQVHFNAGGGTGVEAIYKDQDYTSMQLAEILSAHMSSAMGLQDRGAGSDLEKCAIGSLGIIASAAETGYPSVVTEGGFVDGDYELLKNGDGAKKCAQGIVDGILEYLNVDHTGYGATQVKNKKEKNGIESKIYNMKYVSQEKFQEMIDSGDNDILKKYTLDDNKKLITAKWNLKEDGSIEYTKNSAMDFRTSLQKMTIPFEYLLDYYIDSDYYKGFAEDLAQVAMDSEIVIAIQDNVTTVERTDNVQQRVQSEPEGIETTDWNTVSKSTTKTETCTPKIEITYADTWCVKYYKENSYSAKELGLNGDESEKIVTVKGKASDTSEDSFSGEELVEQATKVRLDENGNIYGVESDGSPIKYTSNTYQKTITNTRTIKNTYDSGDAKTVGNENKFIELYKKHKMNGRGDKRWLFDIIEDNTKTANLLNLTKYLIYKATNVDYGVKEYDFSEFDLSKFNTVGGIYGNTIQEKVWFALRDAGFSEYSTAGVLGNIEAESGFNAGVIEGGSGIGAGLCQWSFGRRTQLEGYAASKGKDWSDENIQIEFLISEVTGQGEASGYASYQLMNYGGYSPDQWINADNVQIATEAFCYTFERPGVPRMDVRIEAAQRYYDEFHGRTKPAGSGNIVETARAVCQYMIENNIYYAAQTRGNIEQTSNSDSGFVCATYVAVVLYRSGVLTADQINPYNYHWTGSGGIPDMLQAAGWTQVNKEDAQPGDVGVDYTIHTFIYAGGDLIYDEWCGEDGKTTEPYNGWHKYSGNSNVTLWRAP